MIRLKIISFNRRLLVYFIFISSEEKKIISLYVRELDCSGDDLECVEEKVIEQAVELSLIGL
jgi:hypothetical protein